MVLGLGRGLEAADAYSEADWKGKGGLWEMVPTLDPKGGERDRKRASPPTSCGLGRHLLCHTGLGREHYFGWQGCYLPHVAYFCLAVAGWHHTRQGSPLLGAGMTPVAEGLPRSSGTFHGSLNVPLPPISM